MSCDSAEKISLLIDGALSTQEADRARGHIAACAECRGSMQDFLGLRATLQGYAPAVDDVSRRRALNTILSSGRSSLWRRRISVPAPAMVMLMLAIIALGTWSAATRWNSTKPVTVVQSGGAVDSGQRSSTEIGTELSRLDHGGRAVIIKVHKSHGLEGPEPEGTRH